MTYDLVIRDGTIVDGLGRAPYRGDVAVRGGVIVAVGSIDGAGRREIDAAGRLVTPGFIAEHDVPNNARPGRLVRGRRPAPAGLRG
jgi:N-acyl-D-aspartate/D-glutamate deacylase